MWSYCLGPALSVDLLHYVTLLHNYGVRMTSGLCKYNHVSHYRFCYWLAPSYLCYFASLTCCCGHSSYYTRTPGSFANVFRYNYVIICYIPDGLYNFVMLFIFVYCLCCIQLLLCIVVSVVVVF